MDMSGIQRIRLWRPEEKTSVPRAAEDAFVTEIAEPELHVFSADAARNTGIGVIITPGGGYAGLSMGPEGHACAEWLASAGITAMVLQYRLPSGDKAIPLEDMRTALSYARGNAKILGFLPEKLGVAGFSAGGHLAAMASTVYADSPVSARPDFSVLFYPVISMDKRKRGVTRLSLLGRHPSEEDLAACSCHLNVTKKTPPALLLLCDDDPLVPPGQSILYYEALKKNGVPASMHIFPEGGHGWGFRWLNMEGKEFRYPDSVRTLMLDWIIRAAG